MRPLTPHEIETATENPKCDIVALFVIRQADHDGVKIETAGANYFETLGILESLRHLRLATRMAEYQHAYKQHLENEVKADE